MDTTPSPHRDPLPPGLNLAHADLGEISRRFLDRVDRDPELCRRLDYGVASADEFVIIHYELQTWPALVGPRKLAEMEHASREVVRLLKSLPERYFHNDPRRFAEYFGLDDLTYAELMMHSPQGISEAIARCDFIDSDDGLRAIEINMSGNIGGWQLRFRYDRCLRNPPLASFLADEQTGVRFRDPIEIAFIHAVESARPLAEHGELHLGIALNADDIVLGRASQPTLDQLYRQVLARVAPKLDGRLMVGMNPQEFRLDAKARLTCNGQRLHILLNHSQEAISQEMFRAFKAETLLALNAPLATRLGDKTLLALLSQLADSEIFDREEKAALDRHLPWCRKVARYPVTFRGECAPLRDFLLTEPHRFVLKAGISHGGAAVHLGRLTPASAWRQLVDEALASDDWLAQEYLESRPYLFQLGETGCAAHDVIWGLFSFGPHYGGGFLRLAPKADQMGVINAARGASEGFLFEVER